MKMIQIAIGITVGLYASAFLTNAVAGGGKLVTFQRARAPLTLDRRFGSLHLLISVFALSCQGTTCLHHSALALLYVL